ncbi:hypothetical protein [Pseudanabaena sp. PCC 6802]|uniref:hypothetical protein n=1 Tax=Pseudanabaena sp. PCC 6802 TaxID=118173 RepID=UPI000346EA22|nr:hypothetical protein [Pseudanabaena sp. PCC 6802]
MHSGYRRIAAFRCDRRPQHDDGLSGEKVDPYRSALVGLSLVMLGTLVGLRKFSDRRRIQLQPIDKQRASVSR